MNVGLRALLVVAAVVCFVIAIFSDVHQGDWIAAGLAVYVGSVLVGEMGWERSIGMGNRRST
jgi:hypothetical protein